MSLEMAITLLGAALFAAPAAAGPFEVGSVIDARLHQQRETNTRFHPVDYTSLQTWEPHAARLREQILASCGLLPMPPKTALRPVITGRTDRGDYTVENVRFQSYPGLYVVGNLYRPKSRGAHPAILNPHGHWANGRLHSDDAASVPGRCINFARQGFVAFAYSMLGYNENKQVEHVFSDPAHELWGISPCGLQLYNSIRAVDFVQSLPDVAPDRIGCTGASGGGTQTFLLSAVDDRVKVCAPVNMISAHMQGGCVCENAPLLRIDTNNVEIGSLMAPRPMFMVAATGDWTGDTLKVEYPAIRSVYALYGAESNVSVCQQEADHNYNRASREAVYPWFGRFLLGDTDRSHFTEQPFEMGSADDLLALKKLPSDALDLDGLTRELMEMTRDQVDGFGLGSRSSLARFVRTFGPGLTRCLAVEPPAASDVAAEDRGSTQLADYTVHKLVIGRKSLGDAIPALLFAPRTGHGKKQACLIAHSEGKAALIEDDRPGSLVSELIARESVVLAIDCFLTGEADTVDERAKGQFFTTFYRTDSAERVQDLLTALAYLRSRTDSAEVNLVGLKNAGLWCLFARALDGGVRSAVIDMAHFDTDSDDAWLSDFFVPGIRRVGDIRAAIGVGAPGRLAVFNAATTFPRAWARRAYAASGNPDALGIRSTEMDCESIARCAVPSPER